MPLIFFRDVFTQNEHNKYIKIILHLNFLKEAVFAKNWAGQKMTFYDSQV
jgi:hypothetical protein